jgi:hypothetical protein
MTPTAQITASFKEVSQSLRRLTTPTADPQTAKSNAQIIAHIEDALIEMIPKVSFDTEAIRKGLQANSSRIARALVLHLGEDGLRGSRQPAYYNLQDVLRAGGVDTLRTLAQMGLPIAPLAPRMVSHAFRHQSDDYMSFIRNELGYKRHIHDHVDVPKILDRCPDLFVETVAKEMTIDLANPSSELVQNLSKSAPSNLKALSILVFTRRDLSEFIEPDRILTEQHPSISNIYQKSRSNHGRLSLLRDEPDLISVLKRSPNGKFFGLAAKALKTTPDW